jgi:hypothetical protein
MKIKFIIPSLIMVIMVVVLATLMLNIKDVQAIDENNCLSCHGVPSISRTDEKGNKISLYVNEQDRNTSAHRFIDCTSCHGDKPHQIGKPLTKLTLATSCGNCHQYEYKLHLESVHGQQLKSGNPDVATCVDCHSNTENPHNVTRVLEYNAPTYKKNIAETCAKCHGNSELMANYGIVEKVYESYMRSFHGKANQLGTYDIGQFDEATCTNCHGTHDIKSLQDPNSSISGLDNLLVTCNKCHPSAGVEFVKGFLGHKEASKTNIPIALYAETFFTILLATTLGFGFIVVVAAAVRYALNKWRE